MGFFNGPLLESELVQLRPLNEADYWLLFEAASDPVLWEHHPIRNGYTGQGFGRFFREALAIGSLVILDKTSNKVIGCTRLYGFDEKESSVVIGHTFLARNYWGSGYNQIIKTLLLDYAFTYVNRVLFYVAENNIRSQKALEKLGARAINNMTRKYGDLEIRCICYALQKTD